MKESIKLDAESVLTPEIYNKKNLHKETKPRIDRKDT